MVAATVAKNGKKPNRGTVAKSGSPSTPVSNTAAATGAESVSAQGVNDSVDDVSENQQPKQGASYREAIDAYTCTGNFSCDFQELCTRLPLARIPDVVPRYKIQSDGAARNLPDTSEQTLDEIADLPKTYRTKGKYEFFKPSVQTVTEVIEKHEAITEMFIRGWKVDNSMMEVLSHCWLTLDKLHAISLWNAGLEEDTVNLLARVLPQCHLLRSVVLDSNPIKVSPWCKLLVPESRLQHLSLRFNQISDEGAAKLGAALTSCQLVQLDLTGNLIGDAGTIGLAQACSRVCLSSMHQLLLPATGWATVARRRRSRTVVSEFALEHEEAGAPTQLQRHGAHHWAAVSFFSPGSIQYEKSEDASAVSAKTTHIKNKINRALPANGNFN
ncbi:PREDICTED: leucine-rich repeat-containing protein 71-like [Priapulus caudatus]|uniref:Leucine-rich repeat-containing protein 71-like n=1 Tax=Priapulus caudatus TaxID=37621 RepID=A0ABM1DS99_PRICU|nr:PREDICTED: leucine-rich repeat-containing protein 71-like [Priapulus caudatus]